MVVGQVYEISRTGTEKLSVGWRIPDIVSLRSGVYNKYLSPVFRMGNEIWCLELESRSEIDVPNLVTGELSLSLFRQDGGAPGTFHFAVGIRASRGVEKSRGGEKLFSGFDCCSWSNICLISELVEEESRLTPNGILTILCVLKRTVAAGGNSASAPRSQSYSGYGSHGGSAPSGYGSQPPSSGVGSAPAPAPAHGAGASAAPPAHSPPRHVMAPPPGGDHNSPPIIGHGGPVPPGGPRPMPGGPGGDYGGLMGYGRPGGGSGGFQGNNIEATNNIACFQQLSDDFLRLLTEEIEPDATLTCDGRTWRVHRSVLSVRSSVFAAMFRSGMSESQTGVVRIEDLEASVLDLLLKYMYCGKVSELSNENVSAVYEAGDKYALLALRKACSDWMAKNLSCENCLSFLVLADMHGDAELKAAAVSFTTEHFSRMESTIWKNFVKEHSTLAVEVLHQFAPPLKKFKSATTD